MATLIRVLGDLDRAEEATSEAVVRALQRWPQDGIPENTVAWLVTTGRNYDTDLLRKRQLESQYGQTVRVLQPQAAAPASDELKVTPVEDDLLRLVFACCHPDLETRAQVLLTLKVVLGFSISEIARSLLLRERTAEQRLTRAKRALREHGGDFALPRANQLALRLAAVRQVIYLLFNQGYSEPQRARLAQTDLMNEAIRLCRMVVRLFRYDPETRSLLALMILNRARLAARMDTGGVFVPLQDQDRQRWSAADIEEGLALIDAVFVTRPPPGPYQLQAAISALHCRAHCFEDTDWAQIIGIYEKLLSLEHSPVVAVNHASAVALGGDPTTALTLLQRWQDEPQLQAYQPYYVALGYVQRQLGNVVEASAAYELAISLTRERAEQFYLKRQFDALARDLASHNKET